MVVAKDMQVKFIGIGIEAKKSCERYFVLSVAVEVTNRDRKRLTYRGRKSQRGRALRL
jgi:hypothetical protein